MFLYKVTVLFRLVHFVSFKFIFNDRVALSYYNDRANVGDSLNVDLFKYYTGKSVVNVPGMRLFIHYLGVGSILNSMTKKSVVWGSGLISESSVDDIRDLGRIYALRGDKTKRKIESRFNIKLNVPLGDPALLMPRVYKKEINSKSIYRFGIVPHYVDIHHPMIEEMISCGGKVIDVSLPVEEFIKQISMCDVILSSSMHGLILADAYKIPNIRLVFSDNITGGDFKFDDYYSTTDNPKESENKVIVDDDFDIYNCLNKVSIKNYIYNLDDLESAFPSYDLK
ncbi:polysaccharide pyruvyl transferase family protein [Vibrio sp. S11_S32]|uniref:polysaccharide pyruvyl transferase family protein n=1 Tax=Vibrio sp. S11_S32 TaxID=2720225 RepID=UPI0016815061|nr:polysaccharide pyruvyl transferase family protein [Vibrio sp. S11_S32]MBD1577917.1 polysaccharide pyruvyl transferase family protein [Vibrio sp. S11_S32]